MGDSFDLVGIHGAGDATPRGSSSYTRFDMTSTAPSHHYPQSLAFSHTSSIPIDHTRSSKPRHTITAETLNLQHRVPRRAPSPPASTSTPSLSSTVTSITSISSLSSTFTSTTSIPSFPLPGHFTLSIPCEFSPYLSCPLRFYHPAEWLNHCLDHYAQLRIPLPSETLCWFCDRYKWEAKEEENERGDVGEDGDGDKGLYASYLDRMMHIAGEWEAWPGVQVGKQRVPRRDHFVLDHLWRYGVVSNEKKAVLEKPESEYFERWEKENLNKEPGRRRKEEAVFEVEGSGRRRERGRWH